MCGAKKSGKHLRKPLRCHFRKTIGYQWGIPIFRRNQRTSVPSLHLLLVSNICDFSFSRPRMMSTPFRAHFFDFTSIYSLAPVEIPKCAIALD